MVASQLNHQIVFIAEAPSNPLLNLSLKPHGNRALAKLLSTQMAIELRLISIVRLILII